ncbi:hypothetical protein Q7P36_005330 [Cladosporium allicinum]
MPDIVSNDNLQAQLLAPELASNIAQKLPFALESLLRSHHGGVSNALLLLDCQLSLVNPANATYCQSLPMTSIDITSLLQASLPVTYPHSNALMDYPSPASSVVDRSVSFEAVSAISNASVVRSEPSNKIQKRRKQGPSNTTSHRIDRLSSPQHHGGVADAELALQKGSTMDCVTTSPSDAALNKLVDGIWQALFSDAKLDPSDFFQADQAIADSPDLRLLGNPDSNDVSGMNDNLVAGRNSFSRINMIARKVSQTSKVCRAIEISVQARWVQCFDDHVESLTSTMSPEAAKKHAMAEACSDFGWSDKELRNKMGIWRGYQEIARHGGYVTLVFAGPGLYRFCKYRLSFTNETFRKLQYLQPAFEVAADTLHPSWRNVLGFLGLSSTRKYTGHLHDWVLTGRRGGNEPVSLASTYRKWDANFSYRHISESIIDEEAWGDYDPRTTNSSTSPSETHTCQLCRKHQADTSTENECTCFPALYPHPTLPPVQIAQTPTGKNNGLFACLPFLKGTAIGEFVGRITTGVSGLDVMFGKTDTTSYQIWQGKEGNFTRFVNHSCKPNAAFEHFDWKGTQRIVLVSLGVAGGEEVTVDYSDTYWEVGFLFSLLC